MFPTDWANSQTKQMQKMKKYMNLEMDKEEINPYRLREGSWFGI